MTLTALAARALNMAVVGAPAHRTDGYPSIDQVAISLSASRRNEDSPATHRRLFSLVADRAGRTRSLRSGLRQSGFSTSRLERMLRWGKGMDGGSGRLKKTLLVALAMVLGTLISVPAAAQDDSAGGDQYGNRGVGERASDDAVRADEAVTASGTFSEVVATDEEEGAVLAAEPQSSPPEATPTQDATAGDGYEGDAAGESETGPSGTGSSGEPALTKLPDTGGASLLMLLGAALAAGGLLAAGRSLSR
jgi:hypothetical protein